MSKFGILFALAALLAACAVSPTSTGPQTVTLKAVDIAYEPQSIEVTAGRPVTLTLVNEGALEHDFNITKILVTDVHDSNEGGHAGHDDASSDLHTSVEPGGRSTLTFTPTTPGTYDFYCSVPGHREAGMVGQLSVK